MASILEAVSAFGDFVDGLLREADMRLAFEDVGAQSVISYVTLLDVYNLWEQITEGKLEDSEIVSTEERRAAARVCELLVDKAGTYGKDKPHPWASEMARKAGEKTSKKKRLAAKENGFDKGSRNQNSRLDETKVKRIRQLGKDGMHHVTIAEAFGVSRQTVDGILAGRTWRHCL